MLHFTTIATPASDGGADLIHYSPDPAASARTAAEWLHAIADRLEAGERLDTFDNLWPLLAVEGKLREVMQEVRPEDRTAAERQFYGRSLPARYMWGAGPMAAWLEPRGWRGALRRLWRGYVERRNQAGRTVASGASGGPVWGT